MPPLSSQLDAPPLRPVVYLFTADGCPACAHAEPEWERFKQRNPATLALEFDAEGPYPSHFGIRIVETPTYVLRVGERAVPHSGAMRAEQLERWIKAATRAVE